MDDKNKPKDVDALNKSLRAVLDANEKARKKAKNQKILKGFGFVAILLTAGFVGHKLGNRGIQATKDVALANKQKFRNVIEINRRGFSIRNETY